MSIIDSIYDMRIELARAGRQPSTVFLGQEEYWELRVDSEILQYVSDSEVNTIVGLELVEVCKESYFRVV